MFRVPKGRATVGTGQQPSSLLQKPQRASFAHGVSADIWEAFCLTYKIEYCEPTVMNSSKIKTWEGGKKESVFVRLGGSLRIHPKEQIKKRVGRLDDKVFGCKDESEADNGCYH
jgi:hypothetical protein